MAGGSASNAGHLVTAMEIGRSGARGRIRTTDTAIFSRVLYQLSYPGTCQVGGGDIRKFTRPVQRSPLIFVAVVQSALIHGRRFVGRDAVIAPQPARQIDIGTARRTERPVLFGHRIRTDRTGFGHRGTRRCCWVAGGFQADPSMTSNRSFARSASTIMSSRPMVCTAWSRAPCSRPPSASATGWETSRR
jgi:hypothetical protein